MMKKIIFLIAGILMMASCKHDVIYEVDYTVTLDSQNTYYAGEPVRFNFDGDVDNLLFYSGETGSQYIYKDRREVSVDEIEKATLKIDYFAQYGKAGALKVWVTDEFEGITGQNATADTALFNPVVRGGMENWTQLTYNEGASGKWTQQEYDITEYISNFCIGLNWCPPVFDQTQRTYWVNVTLDIQLKGVDPISMRLGDLGPKVLMLNKELDPYHYNKGNGSMRFEPEKADVIMQGISGNALNYTLNGWCLTTPQPLTKVANDKGTVIKNLQNYLHSYEYTWEKPGTYKVTFVGRNENYASASQMVKEYTITILPKPEEN